MLHMMYGVAQACRVPILTRDSPFYGYEDRNTECKNLKTHFDVSKTQTSDWNTHSSDRTVAGEHGDMVVVQRMQKREAEGKHTSREGRLTSVL